jgi:hypothetical protein
MPEDRVRRVGENEALFRIVNEQIEAVTASGAPAGEFGVICECAALTCQTQLMISPEVYEQTRARSDRFIVAPGHQLDDIERVIDDHETFFVIEKTPEEAKRIADEMNPRT